MPPPEVITPWMTTFLDEEMAIGVAVPTGRVDVAVTRTAGVALGRPNGVAVTRLAGVAVGRSAGVGVTLRAGVAVGRSAGVAVTRRSAVAVGRKTGVGAWHQVARYLPGESRRCSAWL